VSYVTRYLRCQLCKTESTIDDVVDSPVQMWMCRKCNKVSIREYRPDRELVEAVVERWKSCPKGTAIFLLVIPERGGPADGHYLYDGPEGYIPLQEAVNRFGKQP